MASRSPSPSLTTRDDHDLSHNIAHNCPTGSRSRATTGAPRGARLLPPPCTFPCSTGSRSRVRTAAPRDDRPVPPACTCLRPTDSCFRAATSTSRGVRPSPQTHTSMCSTVCRSGTTLSTLRDVHPSPLHDKEVLDATEDLAVAGAAPRLNIQFPRHSTYQAH